MSIQLHLKLTQFTFQTKPACYHEQLLLSNKQRDVMTLYFSRTMCLLFVNFIQILLSFSGSLFSCHFVGVTPMKKFKL